MKNNQKVIVGLAGAAAVGVTVYILVQKYKKAQINKLECEELNLESEIKRAKSMSFTQEIFEIFKSLTVDIIKSIIERVKNLIMELVFGAKMSAQEKRVDWGL